MALMRRLAAFAAVVTALAVGAPAVSASAADPPVWDAVMGSPNPNPSCPAGYSGPVNLATGCPWWMMS